MPRSRRSTASLIPWAGPFNRLGVEDLGDPHQAAPTDHTYADPPELRIEEVDPVRRVGQELLLHGHAVRPVSDVLGEPAEVADRAGQAGMEQGPPGRHRGTVAVGDPRKSLREGQEADAGIGAGLVDQSVHGPLRRRRGVRPRGAADKHDEEDQGDGGPPGGADLGAGEGTHGDVMWLPRAGGSRGNQTEANRPTDRPDGPRPASRDSHHRWSEGVGIGRRTLRSRPMANRVNREDFGPNTWLVEELYRQYVTDPESVSEVWREFFEDYTPRTGDGRAPRRHEPAEEPREEPLAPPAGPGPERPEPQRPREPKPRAAPTAPRGAEPLTSVARVIAERMTESLEVPTATSFRQVSAKLLEVNREILNNHLKRAGGGKISFTHLIAYAVARALIDHPAMNVTFAQTEDGRPARVPHEHVNLGLAVDVKRQDGTRTLLVPNIKEAETLDFAAFHRGYEDLIAKVNANRISPDDFAGTTVSITNPGVVGTVQSVPRLMAGQAAIIGVGAIAYPAEWAGADEDTLADVGVSKTFTLTSTYDHRVIQGAESGEFLGRIEALLLGDDDFYEDVFASMGVPYVAVEWRKDERPAHPTPLEEAERHMRLRHLIQMYRVRGHLIADVDPLEQLEPDIHPELDPATYGFTIWDLDRTFATGGFGGQREMKLRDILAMLRDAYCRTSTVEYMHSQDPEQKQWIQERVEGPTDALTTEEQRRILQKLGEVEALEQFLHARYVGQRRYSLEGAESMVPMLDAILSEAADAGMVESVIGMAHRGRLDVLTSVVGKSYSDIFREFEGALPLDLPQGSGDVKYHIGAEGKFTAPSGKDLRVTVASNPSHLEAVDPVVEGMVRAKQDQLDGGDASNPILPLLIHGDAAFAGQGVVAETFALSALHGFGTGGTIHVIVNNQVGFTTGSDYGRSSTYASDVAKMVQAPIWHVNGDDPEACVRVARLAFEFRQRFHKDVVIDMWCYRKWGHNEGDDPSFTQPLMYRKIKDLRTIRKRYVETLVNRGDLTVEEAEEALAEFKRRLDRTFDEIPREEKERPPKVERDEPARPKPMATAVDRETLQGILDAITRVPEAFHLHPKLEKWLQTRRRALEEDAVDWSTAEALA